MLKHQAINIHKVKPFKKLPKIRIAKFCKKYVTTHLLKWLYKMYKYEMDSTKTVGTTERTRDAGRTEGWTDGWMDGQTDKVKPIYPLQLYCRHYRADTGCRTNRGMDRRMDGWTDRRGETNTPLQLYCAYNNYCVLPKGLIQLRVQPSKLPKCDFLNYYEVWIVINIIELCLQRF